MHKLTPPHKGAIIAAELAGNLQEAEALKANLSIFEIQLTKRYDQSI